MKYTVSLKENRQFRRLYAKGKSAVSPYLALYYRKGGGQVSRLGITVSGKLGKAVVRNKVRRRLKEAYRIHEAQFLPGSTIVVVARGRAVRASYAELERSLLQLAGQCHLLKEQKKEPIL